MPVPAQPSPNKIKTSGAPTTIVSPSSLRAWEPQLCGMCAAAELLPGIKVREKKKKRGKEEEEEALAGKII